MNCVLYTVGILKKHKNLPSAILYTLCVISFIVLHFVFSNVCCIYIALCFFLMLMWGIDDSFNKERREVLIQHLSDVENTAEKFNIGFHRYSNKENQVLSWVIMPTSNNSYVARNIDSTSDFRVKKSGKVHFLNDIALSDFSGIGSGEPVAKKNQNQPQNSKESEVQKKVV